MDILCFVALLITGFTACAEFGSYAFVHPVVRKLPEEQHVQVEQGLLKTFGRIMPVLMTLCPVLTLAYAIQMKDEQGLANYARWAAAVAFVIALISTIFFNVPINLATGRWNAKSPPGEWKRTRNRWEFFQGVRSWLLLIGFALFSLAVTLRQ
jgi:uncharacterized membrane protein